MNKEDLDFDPSIPEDERRFYLKAYPNVNHVRERKVHCTICKMHIGTAPSNESIIRMHPILRVTHCKKCHDFYNSGEFSKGEDGSELYCRWCGQGGEVYCCSNCPFVFCKSCIISNLSRGVVADIEQNENWSCFNCAPKMLWPLRAQHWALIKFIDKQKKAILNSNLSDAEIKVQMTKDRSLCCKIKKVSGYGTDSSDSSDISLSRLKKKAGEKRSRKSLSKEDLSGGASPAQAKKAKGNDEVVCTPDVLSMLEPECTLTVPTNSKTPTNSQPSTSSPKIMSIQPPAKRINTPPLLVRNAQPAPLRSLAPAQVLKKTVVGPRLPSGQGSDYTTPVYHTINGYRIDLNSAAQQETVRLPNGKLIQVKRQGTGPQQVTTVQNAPTQHSTPTRVIHNISGPNVSPIASVPTQQIVHSSGGHIIRTQLPAPRSIAIQNTGLVNQFQIQHQQQQQQQQQQHQQQQQQSAPVQPQFQQITIRQPNQQIATIRYQGNSTPQVANMMQNGTMQILNGTQVTNSAGQLPNIRPMPTFIKQFFPNTPLGQSRTQLQSQIFNAMEICQHLMGKLQTLTNSNAYKTAKSMTDVKELYIHLSYLLTYAIGRFKGLQDNCLADMRDLGFTNDANSLENGQLAAGMDMVRTGKITDFSNVDLESFHSLIVQNMNLMKSAVADSSTNTDSQTEGSGGPKKLTPLNHNRMIIGTEKNGCPVAPGEDETANDEDEECLLVELDESNSPQTIELESESEIEDCLLVELTEGVSDKPTSPLTPPMVELNGEEVDEFGNSGLLTSYERDEDFTLNYVDSENGVNCSCVFTTEEDIQLMDILKDYPELWFPKESRTSVQTMDLLWKEINTKMPKKQASDAEEDEITIVEPKTDTINLDSDNEDDLPPPPSKSMGNHPAKSVITSNSNLITHTNQVRSEQSPPIVTPTTTTNADDELTAEYDFSKVASLLAGMLEVELTEGGNESPQAPKKPRKKTTNKPNPTLVKQKEIQERERLENIKKNCVKLKMEVQIPLNKVEDIYEYAKPMLEELKHEKLKADEIELSENETSKKEEEVETKNEQERDKKAEETSENDIEKSNPEKEIQDKEDSEEMVVVLVEEADTLNVNEENDKRTADSKNDEMEVEDADPIDQEESQNSERELVQKENSVQPDQDGDAIQPDQEEDSVQQDEGEDSMQPDEEGNSVQPDLEEDSMQPDQEEDSVPLNHVIDSELPKESVENNEKNNESEGSDESKNKEVVASVEVNDEDAENNEEEEEETEMLIDSANKKNSELPLNTKLADQSNAENDTDPLKSDDCDKDQLLPVEDKQNKNDKDVENNIESSSLSHNYNTILGRTEVV